VVTYVATTIPVLRPRRLPRPRVGGDCPRAFSPPGLSPVPAVFPAVSGLSLPSTTASVAGLRWSGPVRRCRSRWLSDHL